MREKLGSFYDPKDLREYEDPRPDWLKGKYGMLSDRDILLCVEEEIIQIFPPPDPETFKKELGTCKIDFHLGDLIIQFRQAQVPYIDLEEEVPPDFYEDYVMRDGKPYFLQPGQTVLAPTKEFLNLPSYIVARVEGKSKAARRGLGIQLAALIDAGWSQGRPTLELHNLGGMALKLKPGDNIGAFSFELLTSPALFPYKSKPESRYKDQDVPRF